jgi:hypothetical protein
VLCARDRADAAQHLRCTAAGAGDRNIGEIADRSDPIFRRLRDDGVGHAVFRVEIIDRRRLDRAGERLARPLVTSRSVSPNWPMRVRSTVDAELRIARRLLDARIGNTGMAEIRRRILLRKAVLASPCRLPATWTSIGAGAPKFRIWLVMSAAGRRRSCRGRRTAAARAACGHSRRSAHDPWKAGSGCRRPAGRSCPNCCRRC